MNCDQRSRARRLDADSGACEVQFERDACRQVVVIATDNDLIVVECFVRLVTGVDIAQEVCILPSTREDANVTGVSAWIATRIFERVPSTL